MSESITCPQCGATSYHPEDIRQRYCGNCHEWHDNMGGKRSREETASLATDMLRQFTPSMSQSMGTVYVEFDNARIANRFFGLLMDLAEQ